MEPRSWTPIANRTPHRPVLAMCRFASLLACVPLVCALPTSSARAQASQPTVFEDAPVAFWVAPPDVPGDDYAVFHVRKAFSLDAVPARFVVHVSGDNRYRLFVNGRSVSTGPQRSDLMHWRYETLDLAPHLHAGDNLLAAVVWNWGPHGPAALSSSASSSALRCLYRAGSISSPASPGVSSAKSPRSSFSIWISRSISRCVRRPRPQRRGSRA